MSRKERITSVIDGDTFETASRKKPIRLANVDAPEKGQLGSVKATEALRIMISTHHLYVKGVYFIVSLERKKLPRGHLKR